MEGVLNQLPIGLSIGAVLLLIALGLTFTFGQMGVINMAHGEFIMAGAYTAYLLQGVGFLVALPAAFVVAGLMGLVLERTLIRRFYGRPLDTLLLTWGVSLMLQQLARDLFGAPNVQVVSPAWLRGGLGILPYNRLFIMALAVLSVLAIWAYMHKTGQGRRMRAVMQNRRLAATSGIDTGRVDQRTFFIGSGLAGVAGVALTLIGPVGPTLGTYYIVDAFLVVVAGGLGQLRGAVLAAIGLGLLNSYAEFWSDASLAKVIVFVAIIGFLQIRPQGLFFVRSRALT
ncbi:urea ABC transporter permease subunit UrtB [Microbispora triticiradicis]|uniref:Urea ABC transporter permease subunit UrtB n=3 Tax=Microbispora TaxID=2005 RepID=A0ABY3M089_9ACTN|nr:MULTISPECIES: urea ABC transporter permease subunit UrtB [Microbispora]RGA07008.1 urea ABC transporter permease subunit UrtB [Microbispora triticiradicis]TLP58743.1 urea ABC transporter permease subunit UrtB [Microbispora fusca]TYB61558.1 urea ABC transporter permease subunit UrtB [Microbispora tritici]GLW21435.1 branched-chain amino acid ABC transporter permease [Microbispora amethystogenes]